MSHDAAVSGKPITSLSLDLDNKWSYMKTHGDPGWQELPSYFDALVPRLLDFLRRRDIRITIFVVGQDADLEAHHDHLRAIAAEHEIGNHSFHHEPWLHLYTREQLDLELTRAEEAIESATGVRPRGFRGPGFSLSPDTVAALAERGYEYDGSTLPTIIGPLARLYYFWTSSGLSKSERRQRKRLFGRWRDGLQPLAPYLWQTGDPGLVEIPVTTAPLLRIPIHFSYVLYLATYSETLARWYFSTTLALCRARGVEPSLLLHGLDFLGAEDAPELAFFPAMRWPTQRKLALMNHLFDQLQDRFRPVTMAEHARLARSRNLRTRSPETLVS